MQNSLLSYINLINQLSLCWSSTELGYPHETQFYFLAEIIFLIRLCQFDDAHCRRMNVNKRSEMSHFHRLQFEGHLLFSPLLRYFYSSRFSYRFFTIQNFFMFFFWFFTVSQRFSWFLKVLARFFALLKKITS